MCIKNLSDFQSVYSLSVDSPKCHSLISDFNQSDKLLNFCAQILLRPPFVRVVVNCLFKRLNRNIPCIPFLFLTIKFESENRFVEESDYNNKLAAFEITVLFILLHF